MAQEPEVFEVDLENTYTIDDKMDDLPPLKVEENTYSEKAASDKAFFAVANEGNAENQQDLFYKAKDDLMFYGESDIVKSAEEMAAIESQQEAIDTIDNLIPDTSIPDRIKESVIRTYMSGGFVSKDLRRRYIEKSVTDDNSKTLADEKQQDNVIDRTTEITADIEQQEFEQEKQGFWEDIIPYAKTTGFVISNIASSVFGGLAGIYTAIKDRDPQKAKVVVENVSALVQEYGYNPKGKDVEAINKKLGSLMETLSIPSEWLGKKALDVTDSPAVATGTEIILDPVGLATVGVSKYLKAIKGTAAIRKGSPAHVMSETNKKNAADMLAASIYDDTGELAKALGADKGEILQEAVLPDLVNNDILKDYPDIRELISLQDKKADYSFHLNKLDPNLVDLGARQADLDLILDVIKETGSPYYQQANSIVTSPGLNVFEGKAVYGRNATGNYVSREGAEFAFEKLQNRIDKLPDDLKGTLEIVPRGKEWVIEHTWKKDYDPLDHLIFGADAVNTRIGGNTFGINVNGLKHSPIGKWLFSTGVFDKRWESAKGRSVDRAAKQANDINREIREHITATKHKKELNSLIEEAESTGKEYFSAKEIGAKFPNLSQAQVDDLFTSHIMWRRLVHYEHRILNNMRRNEMLNKGFETIYEADGNQLGHALGRVPASELDNIKEFFDLETKSIRGTADELKIGTDGNIVNKNNIPLVRLHSSMSDANGNVFEYALLGRKHKLGPLSPQVVPRISGWSPRRHTNHFYIDSIPKAMKANGVDIVDKDALKTHAKTLAGAQTRFEAEEIAKNLQAKHPDREVIVRQDRIATEEQILNDYEVSTELYAQARRRGEGIQNTVLEDRLKTMVSTATSLARTNSLQAWEQATQRSFIKAYGSKSGDNILRNDKFPDNIHDIVKKPNMTKEQMANYKSAVSLFENYTKFKEFSYTSDRAWTSGLHWVADKLESIKLPANLLRDAAKHNNPLVSFPKKLGSFMYISTNVPRQWFIQPQQMAELMAINPTSAATSMADLSRISAHLLGDYKAVGPLGKAAKYISSKMPGTPESEIRKYVQAIRDSGIIDSIDTNVLVHGLFHDVNKFNPTLADKAANALKAGPSTVNKLGRTLGYDPSEILNKTGIWLQMRQKWAKNNPGKDWNTPEAREAIAHDTYLFSGNMNKAGNLPYQAGMLSPLFQFSAIGHKQFMNLMQNTATSLSSADRLRLGAVRASMLGLRYGVPGGGLLYAYIDKYGDAETKENMELVRKGLADKLVNDMLNTYFPDPDGTETSLDVARSVSPLGESGVPYADQVIETLKLIDGKESTNPRFPIVSVATTLGKVTSQWENLWYSNDYTTKEKFDEGLRQALSASSGFNNWFKAMMIIGSGEKMNSLGNPNGLSYTEPEGWATLIGIHTDKEEWAYDQLNKFRDNNKNINDTADDIYKEMSLIENMIRPDGTPVQRLEAISHALDIAVTNEHFTEDTKQKILQRILSRASRENGLKDSVIYNWIENSKYLSDEDFKKTMIILKRDKSPEIQELVKALEEGRY